MLPVAPLRHPFLPFPSPVLNHLRIEGDGPGQKIDPANHLVYDANAVASDDKEEYPRARKRFGDGMNSGWTSVPVQPLFPLFMATWVRAEAQLPGLVGMISVQVNGHLSNILRCYLKRGLCHSRRHYNLLGRPNSFWGHIKLWPHQESGSRL